jgi:predicted phage terminase large subunit-like protein
MIAIVTSKTRAKSSEKRKVLPFPIYRKQADFSNLRTWMRSFCGGRGVGKTHIGAHAVQSTANNGEQFTALSPDAGVVRETTFPVFEEVARAKGIYVRHILSPYPRTWWRTRDGGVASIVFRSAEVPDKLAGPSKAGVWVDEASLVSRAAFDIVIPTLRYKGRMGPLWLTFTPRGTKHWTFTENFTPLEAGEPFTADCITANGRAYKPKPNSGLVRARTRDNPFLPEAFYEIIRQRFSARLSQQELEGDFVDFEGLMFRREWFQFVEEAPRDCQRVRYWDRASTDGDGDYSAGVLIALDRRGIFYIEDVKRGQWSYHDRNQMILQTAREDARRYNNEVLIYGEQEGGSGGKEVSQMFVRMLVGFPVFVDNVSVGSSKRMVGGEKLPGEAKVVRAMGLSAQAEAGNIRIVFGRWNQDYIEELTSFPEYTHDDQVDATSGAFNKLAGGALSVPESATKSRVTVETSRFGAAVALKRIRDRRDRG